MVEYSTIDNRRGTRDRDERADVIGQQMPLLDPALPWRGQLPEHFPPDVFSLAVKDGFAALRNEGNMIFAIPTGVR
jgi:hypothetical protein